jgi:LacI family transcriptional regulator
MTIGKDLAIVAHDDADWTALVEPAITTTAQPVAEMGATAVRMLLERIADPSKEASTVRIAPKLMHRQSCGCH